MGERRPFAYHGSSMGRTFRPGDVLLASPVCWEAVRPGDVVAFRQPESGGGVVTIVHRVCSRTAERLVTQGDQAPVPDRRHVSREDFVGRVDLVQRQGKVRRVCGGLAGRAWSIYLRLRRFLFRLLRQPYRLLQASGVVRWVWRPRIARVHLSAPDDPVVKYVWRKQTVAQWWPREGRFWCRLPFQFVIDCPSPEESPRLLPKR
ncbi:MAG: hypothetical protein JW900_09640 [Anaerolineae bacterium]|nr:hypothetical protein [Anaerolineae bacterium]